MKEKFCTPENGSEGEQTATVPRLRLFPIGGGIRVTLVFELRRGSVGWQRAEQKRKLTFADGQEIVRPHMIPLRRFLVYFCLAPTVVWLVGCKLSSATTGSQSSRGLILVCNKGDHTLGIIDLVAGKQIATVDEEGVTGHEVIASPDGKLAFVPIFGNSGVGRPGTDGSVIRVIDIGQRRIVDTIDFGRGVRPHCAMIGPKNGLLYVTTELENSVTVIDPRERRILYSIPTGQPESHMLAITSDGKRGYVSNVGPGTVSVLDLEQRQLKTVIELGTVGQRIAISRDDKWAFTADQRKPRLAVIDTRKNTVARWVELPGIAYGTAATPDGRYLIVTLIRKNQVGLLNLATMSIERTVDVPAAPQMVVVRPDGAEAYVSCDASGKVAVIDVKEWRVTKLIEAGPGADGLAWAARD